MFRILVQLNPDTVKNINPDLYKNFNGTKTKIAYSVHDGFGLVGEIKDAKQIYDTIKDTCEKESKLCAGLKMKVEVKFGKKLNEMKVFWK